MPTWDDVIAVGQELPGVEVGRSWGRPALKLRGKHLCSLRSDPDALVVPVAHEGEKLALLQEQPDVYFTTPHYDGSAYVLVRLDLVEPAELRELIEDAWHRRATRRQLAERE
jgi:hypothetical protein